MKVNPEKCKGCGFCVEVCPLELVSLQEKVASISTGCVQCQACVKVCPAGAIDSDTSFPEGTIQCDACPIGCHIPPGKTGACRRYINRDGELVRTTLLHTYQDVEGLLKPLWAEEIQSPLVTG